MATSRVLGTLLLRLPAHLGRAHGAVLAPLAAAARLRHGSQRRWVSGRLAAAAAAANSQGEQSAVPEDSHLFQSILSGILAPYWGALCAASRPEMPHKRHLPPHHGCNRLSHAVLGCCPAENTPTAEAVVGALEAKYPEACLGFDHFAFRTFGASAGGWCRAVGRAAAG